MVSLRKKSSKLIFLKINYQKKKEKKSQVSMYHALYISYVHDRITWNRICNRKKMYSIMDHNFLLQLWLCLITWEPGQRDGLKQWPSKIPLASLPETHSFPGWEQGPGGCRWGFAW